MNETFTITCLNWKDEGIYANRKEYISPNEYSLDYQVQGPVNCDICFCRHSARPTVSTVYLHIK